jgi:hypothetical protein
MQTFLTLLRGKDWLSASTRGCKTRFSPSNKRLKKSPLLSSNTRVLLLKNFLLAHINIFYLLTGLLAITITTFNHGSCYFLPTSSINPILYALFYTSYFHSLTLFTTCTNCPAWIKIQSSSIQPSSTYPKPWLLILLLTQVFYNIWFVIHLITVHF